MKLSFLVNYLPTKNAEYAGGTPWLIGMNSKQITKW